MMGDLTLVIELELNSARKLVQVSVEDVMQQLKDVGYFLQLPPGDNRPHPLDT